MNDFRARTFTPDQKLAHLTAYEEAFQHQQDGAHLRRELEQTQQGLDRTETALEIMGIRMF